MIAINHLLAPNIQKILTKINRKGFIAEESLRSTFFKYHISPLQLLELFTLSAKCPSHYYSESEIEVSKYCSCRIGVHIY